MKAETMTSRVVIVFAGVTLLLSLVFTPARSAERPSLLYATAEVGNKLVAFSLEANRVRVIGAIGFGISLPLAFCPPGGVPYTISNLFGPSAQLATLNLGRGAGTLVGSPLGQPQDIMGMTCSRHGILYAVGDSDPADPDYNSLYVINRVTGLASRIGSLGVSDGSGNDFSRLFTLQKYNPVFKIVPMKLSITSSWVWEQEQTATASEYPALSTKSASASAPALRVTSAVSCEVLS